MNKPNLISPLMLSFLDRLSDEEGETSTTNGIGRTERIRRFKQSVVRDLIWVLNTRQSPDWDWQGNANLETSLMSFGLPDFTGTNPGNPYDSEELRSSIETAIRIYEPRLIKARVSIQPSIGNDRNLHFRIAAILNLQPSPEPIVFGTVLNLGTGSFHAQGE